MARRPCAIPGCPTLTDRGRCPQHAREHEQQRGTRQQRGYDAAHDRLRADYQHRMDRGEAFDCWRCGDQIDPEHWHLGHDDDDRSRYRGPECVPCNTATSGRRNKPRRAGRQHPSRHCNE